MKKQDLTEIAFMCLKSILRFLDKIYIKLKRTSIN